MHPTEPSAELVRKQLDKILASSGFLRNDRLSKFLRFLVEQQLAGKTAELKESVLGIEVFGRRAGYDPRQDSVVRTEAAKLRVRLSKYYVSEGAADVILIEVPKGRYTPVFRQRQPAVGTSVRQPGDLLYRLRTGTRLAIALAFLAALLMLGEWWWTQHKSAPVTIAVLPLENVGHDPSSDYFADGLTDEIIRNLSIIDGLIVRSRTSSFAFKGKPRNVREVGKQLEADYVLEGSVLRAGKQLRIDAQLVRTRNDSPVWSARFDRELTDVFLIQDEISRGIVNSLRLKLGRGRRRYETSTEAYDLYLRGRSLDIEQGMPAYDQSPALFEQAIAKDPSFAPAYAGLAEASAFRSGHFHKDPIDEIQKMRTAAEKAVQLDPLLAEGYDALGMAYARDARWQQSENSFRRAVELAPNRSETYHHFAEFLAWPLGRLGEALQELRIAEKNDPLSPEVHFNLAYVLIAAGRYDEAVGECEKLADDFWAKSACLGRARFWQGKEHEAIEILASDFNRGDPPTSEVRGWLGFAYGQVGRRKEAELVQIASPSSPFNQAAIFAGLGDKDRTFEALDSAAVTGPIRMGWTLVWPELALLRGDPRLKTLRRKVGLPE